MRKTVLKKHDIQLRARKALFLDRDGVVNYDAGYTHIWTPDIIVPGIIDLIKRFKKGGYLVFIVTNQSGIGRGYFSELQFHDFMANLKCYLKSKSASIDDFFYCSCNPLERSCFNRKPNPGLFLTAIEKYNIDPDLSLMIGDKITDIEAAASAKIFHRFLFAKEDITTQKKNEGRHYKFINDLNNLEVF